MNIKKFQISIILFLFIILFGCGSESTSKKSKDEFIAELSIALKTGNKDMLSGLVSPECPNSDGFLGMYLEKSKEIESIEIVSPKNESMLNQFELPGSLINIVQITLKKQIDGNSSRQQKFKIPLIQHDSNYYIATPSCYQKKDVKIRAVEGSRLNIDQDVNKKVTTGKYSVILERVDRSTNVIYLKSIPRNKELIVEAYDSSGKLLKTGNIGQNIAVPQSSNHNFSYTETPEYIIIKTGRSTYDQIFFPQ